MRRLEFRGRDSVQGAVACAALQLLPIELVLNVGSRVEFAMVFALLIGSNIGVYLMNQLINGGAASSGVDWSQA